MAEVLGKLLPEADTSMLTSFDDLTELEQSQVTLATAQRIAEAVAEAKAAESGRVHGRYIVALADGRVTTARYGVYIGKNEGV